MLTSSQVGFYATWDEVKITILGVDKTTTYKGFYSIEEALTAVRASVGPYYFISTSLKGEKNTTTTT